MKLTTITHVSVDGVMQGLGGSDEDRRGGFERGGWALPLFYGEATEFLNQVFQRADAFLFGRWTYEVFAGSWGAIAEMRALPIGVALNEKPKYVASTTLTEPQWADTTVLSGDLAAAVRELKAKPAGELQVHGSGSLVRWLFDNARPGGIAVHPAGGNDPGLPAHRPPAVRNGHARPEHVT